MYISKKYLREKYNKLKWDMENCLNVLDEDPKNDKVPNEDALKTLPNIKETSEAIIRELSRAKN